MDWDTKLCFQLIEEYKHNDVLWNPKHQSYLSKHIKHDAWCAIARNLSKDIEEVKKKMLSLLGSFRREKARMKYGNGTAKSTKEGYRSSWFAYEAMKFLIDRNDPKNTINSENSFSGIEESPTDHVPHINSNDDQLNYNSGTQIQTDPVNVQSNLDYNFSDSRQHQNDENKKRAIETDPIIEEGFDILRKPAPNVLLKSSDACTTYGLHVGNKIRRYQPKTRSLVEHYINNILFEADMGKLDFNSTPNPVTTNWEIHSGVTILSNSPKPESTTSSIIDPSDGGNENDVAKYYTNFLSNK